MTAEQDELVARVRSLLLGQEPLREVAMFGGRAFMVNGRMVVSVGKDGRLLVRVDRARYRELTSIDGATRAEMGSGRLMSENWVAVAPAAVAGATELAFWVEIAMEHNRAV